MSEHQDGDSDLGVAFFAEWWSGEWFLKSVNEAKSLQDWSELQTFMQMIKHRPQAGK